MGWVDWGYADTPMCSKYQIIPENTVMLSNVALTVSFKRDLLFTDTQKRE